MHLYLHVPYCAAKCPYCDFNSIAGRDAEQAAYVDALLAEVRGLPRGPYDTVFIGGGTPTQLSHRDLAVLLAGLRDHLRLADGYEWTCEANPGTVDAAKFRLLAEHGVNRLSLGVQSTHDHHLRFLGRVHDSAQAERALALAIASVPRVSADLIMGLPNQTSDELVADLALYRRHGLRHASVYHLTYEPGTEFHARLGKGDLHEIDPTTSRAMYDQLWNGLESLGLLLYETSNFAQEGEASRHNLAYWQQRDYHAAGAGAVSTIGATRITRDKHPGKYIEAIRTRGDATWKVESLTAAETLAEAWMCGLRLAIGVDPARLDALGDDESRWRPRVTTLVDEGLVEWCDGRLRLTRQGRPVQDEVTVYLLP